MEISKAFINRRHEVRAGWRILLYSAIAAIFALSVMGFYSAVRHPTPGADQVTEYILLGAALVLAAFCMLRFVDRRPFPVLGFPLHTRVWVEICQGLLQGGIMVSILFLIEWGTGLASVGRATRGTWDSLRFLGYYLVLFTAAAAFEEVAARGYVFQALIQGIGKPAAVCATSLLFGLGHAANPHVGALAVVNTVFAGVWLSVAYLKTRALWLPISLHMAWNLMLGYVYGFPVSGVLLPEAAWRTSSRGPVWLTGGDYGPEAGAVATGILLLPTVYLWCSGRIRPWEHAVALWHEDIPAGQSQSEAG